MASNVSEQQPVVPSPLLTLARALPGLLVLAVAGLVPLYGVFRLEWSVFAVVLAYVAQAFAAGTLARRRALQARGPSSRPDDDVLISEFFKTYLTVVVAAVLIASMAFGGRLFKPDGVAPQNVYDALATWQYWAVVALLVLAEIGAYAWDRVRGTERKLPPEAFVAEPLRRLFVLQGAAFVLGFIVYWLGSKPSGIAVIVVAETVGAVLLVALARLREARIQAALDAGAEVRTARPAKVRPRGGRKRRGR